MTSTKMIYSTMSFLMLSAGLFTILSTSDPLFAQGSNMSTGNQTGEAMQTAGNQTGEALQGAGNQTVGALQTAGNMTGEALQGIANETGEALQGVQEFFNEGGENQTN
ncbi:MAG TPA: hypothetical protein VE130_05220 [Nitrososphaeraceae archaeon]|nr:hypothetical protein [Nitrososphaeraceae archaeon]